MKLIINSRLYAITFAALCHYTRGFMSLTLPPLPVFIMLFLVLHIFFFFFLFVPSGWLGAGFRQVRYIFFISSYLTLRLAWCRISPSIALLAASSPVIRWQGNLWTKSLITLTIELKLVSFQSSTRPKSPSTRSTS